MRFLRTNEVAEMLGVTRATIWRWEKSGHLPPRRQLGPNVVGWLEEELQQYADSRPRPRDTGPRNGKHCE